MFNLQPWIEQHVAAQKEIERLQKIEIAARKFIEQIKLTRFFKFGLFGYDVHRDDLNEFIKALSQE